MNTDDPVISLIAAGNPVPDPDALSVDERAAAEQLRMQVRSSAPLAGRPARGSRMVRHLLMASAAAVPVVVVLLLALGVRSKQPSPGGATTLSGALAHLQFGRLASELGTQPALDVPVQAAKPGQPQTLLVIGSEQRAGEPHSAANTDTMLLVRLDATSSTINLLSLPRDLRVKIPHGVQTSTEKLNAAYSIGGPSLLVQVLETQVLPGLQVNHVIDANLAVFPKLVDAIGCIDGDVDHRYYNNAAQTSYSTINIPPGYQQLCGTQALQFIRFRNTDSDIVRNARALDFLRWAKDGYSTAELLANLDRLITIIGKNVQTDPSLHAAGALKNLATLLAGSADKGLQQIPFPARLLPCAPNSSTPCYVTATRSDEAAAYQDFLTPTPAARTVTTGNARQTIDRSGLVSDPADGQSQASSLGHARLSIYYPDLIITGSAYCSSIAANCAEAPGPKSQYVGAYPRAYHIDDHGQTYPSYRMTLVINATLGEYYGIQGTTWNNPPILKQPSQTQVVGGRKLLEYLDGQKLAQVAFQTPTATYWVSNTLTNSIPNHQLIAIAASMGPSR
jgi:LCP family protein required for cell wall assembly